MNKRGVIYFRDTLPRSDTRNVIAEKLKTRSATSAAFRAWRKGMPQILYTSILPPIESRPVSLGHPVFYCPYSSAGFGDKICPPAQYLACWIVLLDMESTPALMTDRNNEIAAAVQRERTRLVHFIRRHVSNPVDAEDVLQDVLHDFVRAYRLPEPIEQVGAWLFRVARYRIVDRFRKKKEDALPESVNDDAGAEADYLDLKLPAQDGGPEAAYARAVLLEAMQAALDDLPTQQRDVFVAHELEGRSFKALSEETGIGVNTLLSTKRYAVLFLRRRLQAAYDELHD